MVPPATVVGLADVTKKGDPADLPSARGQGHHAHPPRQAARQRRPLVHLSTRPTNAPCRTVRHRLRLTRATMDLRLDGRCGRAARDAVGALYVSGLLAANGPASGGGRDYSVK
jgi:hypothetical protein